MASSGWQGEKTLYSWGSYSSLAFNLRVDSISRNGNTVSVTGVLRFIYHNSAGGTGYYNYTMSATPAGGSKVSYSTWSGKGDGYYQDKSISGSFTVQSASTTSADFNVSWSSTSGNTGTAKWPLSFPSGGTLPTGLKAEWVSSTWNTVNIKSSVTSWGTYTGTPEIQQIVVDSSATASNWETKGRQVRSAWTTSTSSTQGVTWNGSTGNSTSYSGGITIKGAMDFRVAAWAITSAGTYPGGYINASTTYHTPPAPLQTLSYTQTQGATNVTVNISITGGTSTNNYGNTVTTQYCYSVNGGSYSSWTSAGTGTAWTAKTASFTVPYNASVTVKARQVYNNLASEEKSVSFTSNAGTTPSSLSASITSATWNSAVVSGTVGSYGYPSGASDRYFCIGLNINGSSIANRREAASSKGATSWSTTISNSSSNKGGTFDLKGMLPVYPFIWASNTVKTNQYFGSVYYLPPAPGQLSYTLDSQTPTTKVYTVSYTGVAANNITDYTAADLKRTFRYSTDGGSTWTYVDNAATKALTTVSSFTITLNAQDSVQVEAYLTYKTKNSTASTLTITNSSAPVYLYGSVNGEAKQVIKLYGSANGETVKIKKLYGSVNGVSRLVYDDPN